VVQAMKKQRTEDKINKSFFRSDRMIEHGGQWYFSTREGTMQGPFKDRETAQKELVEYIKIMMAHDAGELTIAPKEPLFSIS
jgi:hypothetical protein